MAPEYLSSNVMNYLVYRYLTESGYLRAADRLKKSWVGASPAIDPDRLPFAKAVKKHSLIELVQDGLFLDDLESKAKHTPRRFIFGTNHGPDFAFQANERREPIYVPEPAREFEQEHEADMANGADVQTPAPAARRTKKKKPAAERRVLNGDAMEVDNSDAAVQPPTLEPSVEPMEFEPAPPSPVVPTLHIGSSHDTQTEKSRDLSANTTFIKRNNPLPVIEWDPLDPQVLFAGGLNQSEMFKIENFPAPDERLEAEYETVELPAGPTGEFEVERFCWIAAGQAVVAVSEANPPDPSSRAHTRLVRLTNWGTDSQILGPLSGIIFALQYQPLSQLLLCVCGLDDKSIIHVWRLNDSGAELIGRRRPIGTKEQPVARVYDAAWISESRFIVCGDCELQIYEIKDDLHLVSQAKAPDAPEDAPDVPGRVWSRLRFDAVSNYAAVVDANELAMRIGAVYCPPVDSVVTSPGQSHVWPSARLPARLPTRPASETALMAEPDEITDLQWQPLLNKATYTAATDDRVLAVSTAAGNVELFAVRPTRSEGSAAQDAQNTAPFTVSMLRTFSMGEEYTAATFSFSPDGYLIAAAGFDTLFIWRTDDNPQRGPRAVWRSEQLADQQHNFANGDSTAAAAWRGPLRDEDYDWPQSLQWDSDGRKLAFGVNDRIAIIRL